MFNLFKKKCNHKYKDFPWYIVTKKNINNTYSVEIKEPYVCVICKNRIDKELSRKTFSWESDFDTEVQDIKEVYGDKIKSAVEVEDMVNDFQLVDKQFLETYAYSQKITEEIFKNIQNNSETDNTEIYKLIADVKHELSK